MRKSADFLAAGRADDTADVPLANALRCVQLRGIQVWILWTINNASAPPKIS